MNTTKCSQCNKPVAPSEKFCPHCGAPQNQPPVENKTCGKCNHVNPLSAAFCEKCGTSLTEEQVAAPPSQPNSNKIVSKGNYSGTMVKGKTSKSRKIFKIILLIVGIIAVIAFVVWFNTDPDAKEKLGNILFGFVVMAIFAAVIWRKSKKGKIQSPKQRKANDDYDDNFETEVDRDDDYDD